MSNCRCYIKRLINYRLCVNNNPPACWLCLETKPIKCVWIMSGFNWITVEDLELRELWECVLLIACLKIVASHKLSRNSRNTQHWVRGAGPSQLLFPVFQCCFSDVLVQLIVFCPLISVVESLLSVALMMCSLLPTGYVANFGVSSVRA